MIELDIVLPLEAIALQVAVRIEGEACAILGPSGSPDGATEVRRRCDSRRLPLVN